MLEDDHYCAAILESKELVLTKRWTVVRMIDWEICFI